MPRVRGHRRRVRAHVAGAHLPAVPDISRATADRARPLARRHPRRNSLRRGPVFVSPFGCWLSPVMRPWTVARYCLPRGAGRVRASSSAHVRARPAARDATREGEEGVCVCLSVCLSASLPEVRWGERQGERERGARGLRVGRSLSSTPRPPPRPRPRRTRRRPPRSPSRGRRGPRGPRRTRPAWGGGRGKSAGEHGRGMGGARKWGKGRDQCGRAAAYLLHALADVPVDEGTLRVHEVCGGRGDRGRGDVSACAWGACGADASGARTRRRV